MILNRELISSQHPLGRDWRRISHPDTITISDIALGTRNSGWIIDNFNNIYFSDNFTGENPRWWQVKFKSHRLFEISLVWHYSLREMLLPSQIIIGRHIHRSDSTLSDQLSRFVHLSKEKRRLSVIGSGSDSIWISLSDENVICTNKTAILGELEYRLIERRS